jgi:RNA polymerase sigma factor (sigma-70 family)
VSRKAAVFGRIVRSVAEAGRPAVTDRELLRRYARENDEAAFAALVARHTAMVFGVCRRALPTVQDAEDATQATFLVLAEKAGSGRWQASVANWLYTAARKVAHNARVAAERRAKREAAAATSGSVEPVDRMTGRELLAALDEELGRLPDRYREPLVLCYLEGLTLEEAAARLGIPNATLRTRVARGRKRLHEALTGAGCGLGAGLLALAVASTAGACPPRLVKSILTAVSGPVPAAVGELAKGVAVNGVLNKAGIALAAVVVVGLGVGLGSIGAAIGPSAGAMPTSAGAAVPATPAAAPGGDPSGMMTCHGRVLGPDGKPVAGAKLYLGYTAPKDMKYPVRAATDDDGRFKFTVEQSELDKVDTDHPTIQVMAVAEGHGCDWAAVGPAGGEVTLRLVKDDVRIGVRILDPEGKPVAGAKLTVRDLIAPQDLGSYLDAIHNYKVYASTKRWDGPLPGQSPVVTTGADGRFKLAGAGRERIVSFRLEGPAIASTSLDVMTREAQPDAGGGPRGYWSFHGASSDYVASASRPVRGVVRDKETGKPIAGVSVEHYHGQGPSALTDKEGRYELLGLHKGPEYALNVKPANGLYFQRRVVLQDTPGLGALACDIELVRGLTVRGQVTDKETGKPVAGARIEYIPLGGNRYVDKLLPGSWDPRAKTVTGADGSYTITVAPGPGVISVTAPKWNAYMPAAVTLKERKDFFKTRLVRDDHEDYFTRYAGGGSYGSISVDFHNAVVLLEPSEKDESLTRDVVLERPLEHKGRIVGPDDRPLVGATVYGHTRGRGLPRGGIETLKEDEFIVRSINPRENRPLVFYHKDKNLGFYLKDLRDNPADPLLIKLQPCGSISGRVVDPDGEPLAGLSVNVEGRLNGTPGLYHHAKMDQDGRFRVDSLVPSQEYRVCVYGKRGASFPRLFARVVVEPGKHKDMGELKAERDE